MSGPDDVTITRAAGVTPSPAAEAYLRDHARGLAYYAQKVLGHPGGLLVSGPTALVVERFGLPPVPPMYAFLPVLAAVFDATETMRRLPSMAASIARQWARLAPGEIVLVLILPEGSGVMTFCATEEDASDGTNAPGGVS